MGATIVDIARIAGVSLATASRALNNQKGISSEKRDRVLLEAEKMGFKQNVVARALRMKSTRTIGLVIPDIGNPYFPELVRGVERAGREVGYSTFVFNTGGNEAEERACLESLFQNRVEGLIIETRFSGNIKYLQRLKVPVVYLNSKYAGDRAAFVNIDNVKGAFTATDYLYRRGYQRVAYVGGDVKAYSNKCRLDGYLEAQRSWNHDRDGSLIVEGSYDMQWGYRAAKRLLSLENPPDAIFAANDVIALGIIQYAQKHQIRIPDELGIVGFDDIYTSRLPGIELTTISVPKDLVGKKAFTSLLNQIQTKGYPLCNEDIHLELVVRKTTR